MYKTYVFLHLFFAIVWIGGMFFNLLFLTPALRSAEENCRKEVAPKVLGKFFWTVWLSIIILFGTGMALWHKFRPDFFTNSLFHFKLLLFAIMVLNFIYIHAFLYRKRLLDQIPVFIGINLILGILIVMIITYIR
ncbi:MAG: hypothetical protein DSY42_02330 [Aquifex sp.]|nr:MAG: hypothetical protein DSY42_02330 [Aquifex sp.]